MAYEQNVLDPARALDALGRLRAEWLTDDQLFSWFLEPKYFPSLESSRSCVLKGGRGTGKTTVLRCLSYQGQEALMKETGGENINLWKYFGFYYRVNTNRVTAFQGEEFTDDKWAKFFAHYLNILFCGQLCAFVDWFENKFSVSLGIPTDDYAIIGDTLGVSGCKSNDQLLLELRRMQVRFEAYLNNLDPDDLPFLSLQGAPVDEFCGAIKRSVHMGGKSLFLIVDEFENLLPFQQRVMNTLIKQADDYGFKIGVRELGWRERRTLNPTEQLVSPADYELIDIASQIGGSNFKEFAEDVCRARLRGISGLGLPEFAQMSDLLQDISIDEEAKIQGVEANITKQLAKSNLPTSLVEYASSLPPLRTYLILEWSRDYGLNVARTIEEHRFQPKSWDDRYGNYKYTLLFRLSAGRSLRHRKYYSGWQTLARISGGNIRYLLQLIYECVRLNLISENGPEYPISYEIQTQASVDMGRQSLSELEGLSVNGGKLTRMVLSLGRIFNVFSDKIKNVAPETNQFSLPEERLIDESANQLLQSAVMHMALLRSAGTKRTDESSTKDFDYALHPIFAPYFSYSHRRKRKTTITQDQLIGLVDSPRDTIKEILSAKSILDDGDLPQQLRLFSDFYDK